MTKSAPRPGRPRAGTSLDRQAGIIQAACQLYASHGIAGTSNQMLARAAGVTPALVNYYFKSRDELDQAVLEQAFAHLPEKLAAASSLEEWVRVFHDNLMLQPWIPHLMMREVIPHDGRLQDSFLAHYARDVFTSISRQIQAESRRLGLSPRFHAERHVVLLMGLLVYPFIARGLGEKITGHRFDDTMMQGFRHDALCLFMAGLEQYTQEGTP